MDPLLLAGLGVAALVGLITLFYFIKSGEPKSDSDAGDGAGDTEEQSNQSETTESDAKTKQPKSKIPRTKNDKRGSAPEFKHPWLLTTLKGHGDQITSFDISPNGKFLVSTAEDRSMFLWSIKDISSKTTRSVRCNVEYDCARLVKFSPDNRSFITSLENGNSIRVFKFGKNDDGTLTKAQPALDDFPQTHAEEIIAIGIDSAGNYIMTADRTTKFDILSLKGEKYATVDTATMKNSHACVSPCGRFVAVCGFTPDVRVWEVSFDKARNYKGVKRAFDLTGHRAGVLTLAFSADSSRMVTVSKDNTWKLWKTDVEYSRGESPHLLHTEPITGLDESVKVALPPDGKALAVACQSAVTFYNCVTFKKDETIASLFTGRVRHLMFSTDGRYLYCCGDRNVKVFKNVTGVQARADHLTEQLRTCNKSAERRITDQLNEAKAELAAFEI